MKQSQLFENVFDEIDGSDDAQIVRDITKDQNNAALDKENNDTDISEYKHILSILININGTLDARLIMNNAKDISNDIIDVLDDLNLPLTDYKMIWRACDSLDIAPLKMYYDPSSINNANILCNDPGKVLKPYIDKLGTKNTGLGCYLQFDFNFNIPDNITAKKFIRLFNQFESLVFMTGKFIQNITTKRVSIGTYINRKYIRTLENFKFEPCQYNIFHDATKVKFSEDDQKEFASILKQKWDSMQSDKYLLAWLPNRSYEYLRPLNITIKEDSSMSMLTVTFPKTAHVNYNHILHAWYYPKKNVPKSYTIEIYIDGVFNLENKLDKRFGNWFESIKRVRKICCNGTDWTLLDMVLTKWDVDIVDINGLKLNDATNIFKTASFKNYVNKNIRWISKTHNIEFFEKKGEDKVKFSKK